MPTDLTIILQNRPGTIADLGEAMGRAGVNMRGACGFECGGVGIMHVVVDDAATARRAAEDAGLEVRAEREVIVVPVEDRPGSAGEITRRIADAGVNVDLIYLTQDGQLVLGPDDVDRARAAV